MNETIHRWRSPWRCPWAHLVVLQARRNWRSPWLGEPRNVGSPSSWEFLGVDPWAICIFTSNVSSNRHGLRRAFLCLRAFVCLQPFACLLAFVCLGAFVCLRTFVFLRAFACLQLFACLLAFVCLETFVCLWAFVFLRAFVVFCHPVTRAICIFTSVRCRCCGLLVLWPAKAFVLLTHPAMCVAAPVRRFAITAYPRHPT